MTYVYVTRLTLPEAPAQRRRASSEGAHCLLAYALKEQGIDPSAHPFCRTPEGKPYLAGSPVEISLSHSGSWAVCALSDAPVGVDIEAIRPISAGVWRKLLATTADEPCGSAYEATLRWTRYEASLKRLGYSAPIPDGVEFATFRTIPGYLLTVCGAGKEIPIHFVSVQTVVL